jgi:hypothetical protein
VSWLDQYHSISEFEVIDEISQAYMGWRYGGKSVNLKQMRQLLINLKSSHWKRLKQRKWI